VDMIDLKEQIKRNFSKSAKVYDDYATIHREVANSVLGQVPEKDYKYILDIGTGTGFLAFGLAERFNKSKIFAIDIAPGMIEHARAKSPYSNIQFLEGDGEKIPFADNTFDLVVSSSSFQWMHPGKCFSEVKRVLKPGQSSYFSFFGPKTLIELKDIMGDRTHVKYPSPKELKKILNKLKFTNIELKSEIYKESFEDFMALLQFIKHLGAQTAKDPLGFNSRKALTEASWIYKKKYGYNSGIIASFEIIYGRMRN